MMKASVAAVMMTALVTTGAAANNWSSAPRDDGQTQFWVELNGSVPQRCQMYTTQDKTIGLDLANGGEKSFTFKAWCNNDSSKGQLVVGANPLTNANKKDIIPLDLEFNGDTGTIDANNHAGSDENYHAITSNFTVDNSTESGNAGQDNVLKIKPVLNGWEKAGEYKTSMYVSLYPM
ncbi:hypothetical protein [Ferrimonas balearica]|uniref:hypothetical protein n=1 Tax=Ferrimonas balearica TaxID=44012 RepID=UPI001FEF0112|nr:hypothetical protein [Ferrimonas balearica]